VNRALFALALGACGEGTVHQIGPDSVSFGNVDCGTAASPRVFEISNPNADAFTFDATFAAGDASMYTIDPAHATVLPHGQLELTIRSRPIPATSETTDNLYGDTLVITTTIDHDTPHSIPIKQTAHGAILAFSTPSIDFGTAALSATTPATQAFTLTNTGNASASVTLAKSDASYTLTPDGASTLAAGAALDGQIGFLPRAVGNIPDVVTATADGPVCGPPAKLAITATGIAAGTARKIALAPTRGRPSGGGDFQAGSSMTLCVLTTGHVVVCTGADDFGARGAGGTTVQSASSFNLVHTATGVLDNVDDIQGGRGMFCALRSSEMWCWGDYNGAGRSHQAAVETNNVAVKLASDVGAIALGYSTRCFITASSGTLSCAGAQTGNPAQFPISGWTIDQAQAVAVFGGTAITQMADGSLRSFGENGVGVRGSDVASEAPASPIALPASVASVAISGSGGTHHTRHACASLADGSVYCWGENRHGQLGDGTTNSRDTTRNEPVQAMIDSDTPVADIVQVTAGQVQSCARTSGGAIYCWGRNQNGELGQGSVGSDSPFAKLVAVPPATQVVSAQRTTCVVTAAGGIRCWGDIAGPTPTALATFEP
jgi:hypothetical protein